MSADRIKDLSKLCIHTITLKPWTIEQAAKKFSEAGVAGITVWRDAVTGRNIRETGKLLRSLNLKVVSMCSWFARSFTFRSLLIVIILWKLLIFQSGI